jgi:L-threonylcarbamoyladenylate synthase
LADLRGRIDLIVDGGPCSVGVESTIIACHHGWAQLRPGGIARDAIERVLGTALSEPPGIVETTDNIPLAPGMLASHYAPKAALRLNALDKRKGEALLAFGPSSSQNNDTVLNLSPSGDLVEAAANLFSHLRALDATGARAIAVTPIPREGLGEAINDRLERAAAPRTPS